MSKDLNNIKKSIIKSIPNTKCCKNSFILGIMIDAKIDNDALVFSNIMDDDIIPFSDILTQFFHREINMNTDSYLGRIYHSIRLVSEHACQMFTDVQNVNFMENCFNSCSKCLTAFLRGVFVSVGHLYGINKSMSLVLSIHNDSVIPIIQSALQKLHLNFSLIQRKNVVELYTKSQATISDFISILGSDKFVFGMINQQIEKDIRNQENRATNCVTHNIAVSVHSSSQMVMLIKELIETKKITCLSPDLQETAILRLNNPDLSLSELALLHNPPISKSGLNHRLEKIKKIIEHH